MNWLLSSLTSIRNRFGFDPFGRSFPSLAAGLLLATLTTVAVADSGANAPTEFLPVDTSRLLKSPYPYVLENAFPKLDFTAQGPLQVLAAPGDETHLYAVCRNGELHRFVNDSAAEETTIFLDVSHKTIRDGEEQGLLGFAFHPDYQSNGECYACYATPTRYGGAALFYDAVVVCLVLLGAVVGLLVPVPRRLAHVLAFIAAVLIGVFLVFLLVPTSGITSDQKKLIAGGIFAAGFIGVIGVYGFVIFRNEKVAKRLVGLSGGLFGASVAVGCLTLMAAKFVDPSNVSIFSAHSTSFQAQVYKRLARQAPDRMKNKLQYALPTPKAELVVSRFRRDEQSAAADLASEEVLVSVAYPSLSHYGGSIEFGTDGYLYIGTGDGMFPAWGQDPGTLHAAILRIDVDRRDPGMTYAIPPTNPYSAKEASGDGRPEVWAYGLRNVWRLSCDRETGRIWAGDVGLNRFEEVNLITKGGNYGWARREGFHANDEDHSWDMPAAGSSGSTEFVDPVITYDHRFGRAIVGGRVYRGKQFPELQGAYLYGDYASGIIWAGHYAGKETPESVKLASPKIPVAGFGEDQEGELYVCSLDGGIYRFHAIKDEGDDADLPFPQTLSETGLFSSIEELTPVAGMIAYDVNVPLWSDGADKQRFMALPAAGQVEFSETEPWTFPVGTVFVNNFSIPVADEGQPSRRLESRLWVHGKYGWDGHTYVWNDEQSEAHLVEQPVAQSIAVHTDHGVQQQQWSYLTNEQCSVCHSKANGFVLGVNTRQMNRDYIYSDEKANQIELLDRLGIFKQSVAKLADELPSFASWDHGGHNSQELARAYLQVNCAVCHVRDRLGITSIDLRYETPLADMNLVGRRPRRPKSNRSSALTSLLEPGQPENSELLRRIQVQNEDRMPPLARSVPDHAAAEVIKNWIAGMLDASGKPREDLVVALKPGLSRWTVPESYDASFVAGLVKEARLSGDPIAGREVYLSPLANCKACHHIGSGEPAELFAKGPDLTNVGSELSIELLAESILWPGRTVKKGFELRALLLDDGRAISGYVTAEDEDSVTMRDFLTGKLTKIDADTIEHFGETRTAMPSDVTTNLSRTQVRDLIAYLSTLKNVPTGSELTPVTPAE